MFLRVAKDLKTASDAKATEGEYRAMRLGQLFSTIDATMSGRLQGTAMTLFSTGPEYSIAGWSNEIAGTVVQGLLDKEGELIVAGSFVEAFDTALPLQREDFDAVVNHLVQLIEQGRHRAMMLHRVFKALDELGTGTVSRGALEQLSNQCRHHLTP